jgi:hypothetical protein
MQGSTRGGVSLVCVCASSTGRRCSTKTWYLMQSASIRTLYSARSLDRILAIGSNLKFPVFSQLSRLESWLRRIHLGTHQRITY